MSVSARYAVPLLLLSGAAIGFFAPRRFRPLRPRIALGVGTLAVLPLLASGTLHLLRPAVYVALIPPPFPKENWFAMLTGLPELLGAAGLLLPATRRPAAVCLAVFLIAIFPANVYVAGRTIAGLPMPGVAVRTAMQAAYLLLVLAAGWGVPAPRLPSTR